VKCLRRVATPETKCEFNRRYATRREITLTPALKRRAKFSRRYASKIPVQSFLKSSDKKIHRAHRVCPLQTHARARCRASLFLAGEKGRRDLGGVGQLQLRQPPRTDIDQIADLCFV